MSWYEVERSDNLYGEIRVQGSKNAVLPILAASLLAKDTSYITGCPDIVDVHNILGILKMLGCKVNVYKAASGLEIEIDSSCIKSCDVSEKEFGKMRASIIFLGALLGATGYAKIGYPGGCVIGNRPIDMHIKALKELGAELTEKDAYIEGKVLRFKGKDIYLEKKSVGTTENVLMAAVTAEGITRIHNCSREPEIVELCRFLRKSGACISGDGTNVIKVCGTEKLHGCQYTVGGDRIVAATYMTAVCICGGKVKLNNIRYNYCKSTIELLKKSGMDIRRTVNGLCVEMDRRYPEAIGYFSTGPYPEVPTDIQPLIMSAMCFSKNITLIKENIFENRFRHVSELVKMGADITVSNDKCAVVNGRGMLIGNRVNGKDLRGTAALILAGLGAYGRTRVNGSCFIERGYEDIVSDLNEIGGRIKLNYDEENKMDSDIVCAVDCNSSCVGST